MYELLILGALMAHERSGYKLGLILEASLEPRRKISNGVIYPMLHKLEDAGFITVRVDQSGGRSAKIATITPAGRARLHVLMQQPVPEDAKRESTYRFKFRALSYEPASVQRAVLSDFADVSEQDALLYARVHRHLSERLAAGERSADVTSALRMFELQESLAQTKRDWAKAQMAQLPSHDEMPSE